MKTDQCHAQKCTSLTDTTVASFVSLILVTAFKSSLEDNSQDLKAVDVMWRLLIGLGCIPGIVALYFRLTIPESPRYTADIERNVLRAAQEVELYLTDPSIVIDPDAIHFRVDVPRASKDDFLTYFRKCQNSKVLLGTCLTWFCQDVSRFFTSAFYVTGSEYYRSSRSPSMALVSIRQQF